MILLNQPWSHYEQQLALERRRQAVRRAGQVLIWGLGILAVGIALGMIIRTPTL